MTKSGPSTANLLFRLSSQIRNYGPTTCNQMMKVQFMEEQKKFHPEEVSSMVPHQDEGDQRGEFEKQDE